MAEPKATATATAASPAPAPAPAQAAKQRVSIDKASNPVTLPEYQPSGLSGVSDLGQFDVPGLNLTVCQYHLVPRHNNKAVETNSIEDPKIRALLLEAQNSSGVGGPVSTDNHPSVPKHLFTGGKLIFLDAELWWFRREHYNRIVHGNADEQMRIQGEKVLQMDAGTPEDVRERINRQFQRETRNARFNSNEV